MDAVCLAKGHRTLSWGFSLCLCLPLGSVSATRAPRQGGNFLTACLIAVFLKVLIKARTLHSSNRHYMHLLQVIRFRKKKNHTTTTTVVIVISSRSSYELTEHKVCFPAALRWVPSIKHPGMCLDYNTTEWWPFHSHIVRWLSLVLRGFGGRCDLLSFARASIQAPGRAKQPQRGLQKCQEGHQQEQAFTTQGLVPDFLSSDLHKSGASRLREALVCKSGALCAP